MFYIRYFSDATYVGWAVRCRRRCVTINCVHVVRLREPVMLNGYLLFAVFRARSSSLRRIISTAAAAEADAYGVMLRSQQYERITCGLSLT